MDDFGEELVRDHETIFPCKVTETGRASVFMLWVEHPTASSVHRRAVRICENIL